MKNLLPTLLASLFCAGLFAQSLSLQDVYQAGSTGKDGILDFVLDSAGNKYTVGYFSGTVDFDKGPGTANLSVVSGQSETDGFIVKLDAQNNYKWAVRIGGTNNGAQRVTYVKLDLAGDLVVIGSSTGQLSIPGGTNYSGNFTDYAAFVIKLDTATGAILWSNVWGNINSTIYIAGFAIDNANNIVLACNFTNTVDFDPGPSTNNGISAGLSDFVIIKMHYSGYYISAQYGGGSGYDGFDEVVVLGNTYFFFGTFSGTVDFNLGNPINTLTSAGGKDVFILKTSSSLNYQNALQFGGLYDDPLYFVRSKSGYLYLNGNFSSLADLDPSPTATTAPLSPGGMYLTKLDANLNFMWAKTWLNSENWLRALEIDAQENIHLAGLFRGGTFDADPSTNGVFNLTNPSSVSSNIRDSYYIQLDSGGVFNTAFSYNIMMPAAYGTEGITSIKVDQNGKVLLGGMIRDTVDVNPQALSTTTITSAGEDDAMMLTLHVCTNTAVTTLTVTACGSYTLPSGTATYTTSGTYTDVLIGAQGCDSVLSINLTIQPNTIVVQTSQTPDSLYVSTTSPNPTFQWIDCTTNQIIPGATSQTFVPTANGLYGVIVTSGVCNATSPCMAVNNISIDEATIADLRVYPNPTSGFLRIESPQPWQKVEVVDLLGKIVYKSKKEEIDLTHLPTGMYLVKVYFEEGVAVERVIKD